MADISELTGLPGTLYLRCWECCKGQDLKSNSASGCVPSKKNGATPRKQLDGSKLKDVSSTPDVQAVLDHWWNFVPKTWLSTINQYVYNMLHEMLCEAIMKDFGLPVKNAGSVDMERNWNEDCCKQPSMTRSDFFKMLMGAARVSLQLKATQLCPDTAAAFLREKLDQVKEMESRHPKLGVKTYIGPLEEAWHVEAEGISSSILRPSKNRRNGTQTLNTTQEDQAGYPAHVASDADGNNDEAAAQTIIRGALLNMDADADALSSDGEDKATSSVCEGSPLEAEETALSLEEDQNVQQEKRASLDSDRRVSVGSEQQPGVIPEIQQELRALQSESAAPPAGDVMGADSDINNGNNKQAKQVRRVEAGCLVKSNVARKIAGSQASCPSRLLLGGSQKLFRARNAPVSPPAAADETSRLDTNSQTCLPVPDKESADGNKDVSRNLPGPHQNLDLPSFDTIEERQSPRARPESSPRIGLNGADKEAAVDQYLSSFARNNSTDGHEKRSGEQAPKPRFYGNVQMRSSADSLHRNSLPQRMGILKFDASVLDRKAAHRYDTSSLQLEPYGRSSVLEATSGCLTPRDQAIMAPEPSQIGFNLLAEQDAQAAADATLAEVGEILQAKLRDSMEMITRHEDPPACSVEVGHQVPEMKEHAMMRISSIATARPHMTKPDRVTASLEARSRNTVPEGDAQNRRKDLLRNPRTRGPYLATNRTKMQSSQGSRALFRLPGLTHVPPGHVFGELQYEDEALENNHYSRPSCPEPGAHRPTVRASAPSPTFDIAVPTSQRDAQQSRGRIPSNINRIEFTNSRLPQILGKQKSESFGQSLSTLANGERALSREKSGASVTGGSAVTKHFLTTHSGLHTPFISLRNGPSFKASSAAGSHMQSRGTSRGAPPGSRGLTSAGMLPNGAPERHDFLRCNGVSVAEEKPTRSVHSRNFKIRESYEAALNKLLS